MSVERVSIDCAAARLRRRVSGATVQQFMSFLLVGSAGFVIDAALFWIGHEQAHWSIFWARALSASVAVTATWLLNRAVTFRRHASEERAAEYFRYVISQGLGLVINLGVFAGTLWLIPSLRRVPIVALVLGSAVALLVNFITAKTFAFRARRLSRH
jgi:putative flippase GtrA